MQFALSENQQAMGALRKDNAWLIQAHGSIDGHLAQINSAEEPLTVQYSSIFALSPEVRCRSQVSRFQPCANLPGFNRLGLYW